MNAPTFDAHSSICPICHHPSLLHPPKLLSGLVICQHCRERLVISRSGNFVRDPFQLRQQNLERSLRRESHPFYRVMRDLRLSRTTIWIAFIIGTVVLGTSPLVAERLGLTVPPLAETDTAKTQ